MEKLIDLKVQVSANGRLIVSVDGHMIGLPKEAKREIRDRLYSAVSILAGIDPMEPDVDVLTTRIASNGVDGKISVTTTKTTSEGVLESCTNLTPQEDGTFPDEDGEVVEERTLPDELQVDENKETEDLIDELKQKKEEKKENDLIDGKEEPVLGFGYKLFGGRQVSQMKPSEIAQHGAEGIRYLRNARKTLQSKIDRFPQNGLVIAYIDKAVSKWMTEEFCRQMNAIEELLKLVPDGEKEKLADTLCEITKLKDEQDSKENILKRLYAFKQSLEKYEK